MIFDMTDTYHSILEVAERLFTRQGYTATSMRQIAEEVGIGKATIYHHFPDKQTIALALLDSKLVKMSQTLDMIRVEASPCRRIEVAVDASIRFLYESAELMQTVRREVPGARDKLYVHIVPFFRSFSELMAEAFQRGMEMGIFRLVDPHETARVLMTMVQGNFVLLLMSGVRAESSEKAALALLDVFYNGIKVKQS